MQRITSTTPVIPATTTELPGSTLSRTSAFLSLSTTPENKSDFDEPDEEECQSAKNAPICKSPVIITNTVMPDGIKPGQFLEGKDRYLPDYLLNRVNSEGKPSLLLRPLAALLALFGIHGFGQTNCASCATAVAETLEKNVLYHAMPKLKGADVKGIMGLPIENAEPKSASELICQLGPLGRDSELNCVLIIHRPAWLRMLPGAKQGHACNVIKFKDSNLIHFVDTQKKTYVECHLDNIAGKCAEIRKFIGPIGDGGIDLYKKEFHADISKKAGASSAPA